MDKIQLIKAVGTGEDAPTALFVLTDPASNSELYKSAAGEKVVFPENTFAKIPVTGPKNLRFELFEKDGASDDSLGFAEADIPKIEKSEEAVIAIKKDDAEVGKITVRWIPEAETKLIESLKAQIEERKKSLQEKNEAKAAKEAENEPLQKEAEEARKQLKEAQDRVTAQQKERDQLEEEKTEIQPAYERALENRELRERADALKKEIAAEEEDLQKTEDDVKALETKLEDVSAAYKREREAKENLQRILRQELEGLQAAVKNKIQTTLRIDDPNLPDEYLNASESVEVTEDIFRQHGREINNNTKVARELESIVEMKKEALGTLETGTEDDLRQAREDRDEAIRQLVWQLQDERNNLHADIEEIRKINREQAVNLRRGHVERHADPQKFQRQHKLQAHLRPGTDPHSRRSVFKRNEKPTNEMVMLNQKNKELENELNEIKQKITQSTSDRTEVVKQTKALEARIRRDAKTFETELSRIEADIVACEHKVGLLDRDNSRMTEAVQHLGGLIKSTKDHMEHVRGKTEPLPIE